jgi:hypothetical protein
MQNTCNRKLKNLNWRKKPAEKAKDIHLCFSLTKSPLKI